MASTVQFLLTLVASVAIGTVGIVRAYDAEIVAERLTGALILVALPIVLGWWFRSLRRYDPPIWWELRQRVSGATGEPLPFLEPTHGNIFFPLPWFLLPLIPIAVSVGVVTGHTLLFWIPAAAAIGWVGAVGVVVVTWAAGHRATKASGLGRMLADFRQVTPPDATDPGGAQAYAVAWAHRVFDRHRPTMDVETMKTLARAGVEDEHDQASRGRRVDVTRLPPWYARQGWLSLLEKEGLVEREASEHRGRRTDPPREMPGWQCPRCHTVNEPGARRCTLRGWWQERLCHERRPGLSWIADDVFTVVDYAVGVVFMVLVFGPFLLAILAVYGVLTMHGSGDPTGLVAAAVLTVAWLVLTSLPVALAKEARESLGMLVAYFGWLPFFPFLWLAATLRDVLRRVLRSHAPVEVVADGSTLVVQPRIVKPGKVTLRISNKASDADVQVTLVRTDYRPGALPDDLDELLAGRPHDAVVAGRAWSSPGTRETTELSLTPGRYVIAASTGPDRGHRNARMRSTLLVESSASNRGA